MKKVIGLLLSFVVGLFVLPAAWAEDTAQELILPLEADTCVFARAGNAEVDYNYGGAETITVSRVGNRRAAVLRFAVGGVDSLPDGAVISDVTLSMTVKTQPSNAEVPLESGQTARAVYNIGRFLKDDDKWDDWAEGTANGTAEEGSLTGTLMNARAGNTTLKPSGVAYTYQAVAAGERLGIDVKPLMDQAKDGKLSIWMACNVDRADSAVPTPNIGDWVFYSQEAGQDKAPKLTVHYTVPSGDAAKYAADAAALALTENNEALDLGHIARDITLPAAGSLYGSNILWETTDASVVTDQGAISRPAGSEEFKPATLTATVGAGANAVKKTFEIQVTNLKYPSADLFWTDKSTALADGSGAKFQTRGRKETGAPYRAGLLRFDLPEIPAGHAVDTATLTLEKLNDMVDDIHVGVVDPGKDTWFEYNQTNGGAKPALDSRTGEVTVTTTSAAGAVTFDIVQLVKSEIAKGNTEKICLAVYSTNTDPLEKTNTEFATREAASGKPVLAVTTAQSDADQLSVEADKLALEIGDVSNLVAAISLPAAGPVNGNPITWESSSAAVIETDGTVHRPSIGEPNATAVLKATIKKNGKTAEKEFPVCVLSKSYPEADATVRGYSGADMNAGAKPQIDLRFDHYRMGYVRYDLTGISEAVTDASVTFYFKGTARPKNYNSLKLLAVRDNDWTEGTFLTETTVTEETAGYLTYNNKPAYGRVIAQGESAAGGDAVTFSITDYAAVKAAACERMSFALISAEEADSGQESDAPNFYLETREGTNRPLLTIATQENQDLFKLLRDVAAISLPEVTRTNLSLPGTGTNGTSFIWASASGAVSQQGEVTRPPVGGRDEIALLTLTASNGAAAGKQFTFEVTVPAQVIAITNVKLSQGETVYSGDLPASSAPKLTADVWNDTASAKTVSYYIGVFRGNRLVKVIAGGTGELVADARATIDEELGSLSGLAGAQLRVFAWNDMTPLRSVIVKNIIE